jgi:hypothetical protein
MTTRWLALALLAAACTDDGPAAKDPRTAERAPIDRFGAGATHHRRADDATLPGPNQAIDYDARFRVEALGPAGQRISLYDFDAQPRTPAPIYVLFRDGEDTPVKDQKNLVTVIPGDPGYSDLWQPVRVDVPADYVANTYTSFDELVADGLTLTPMPALVNCPVVPEGSVARTRMPGGYSELTQGWYGGRIIQYFHFGERPSLAPVDGQVPLATMHVAFAINPGEAGGGLASGFATETGSAQTHNVAAAIPADAGYSPLWSLRAYDTAAFATVTDLATATAAPTVALPTTILNAPIVAVR